MNSIKILISFCVLCLMGCAPEASFNHSISTDNDAAIINGIPMEKRNTPASRSVIYIELIKKNKQTAGFCTGTLIGPNTVLTAAHCFDDELLKNFDSFNIVFENKVTNSFSRLYRHGLSFVNHPKYNSERIKKLKYYDHDIAVASFSGQAPKGFAPVKLDSDITANYIGLSTYVYGFGRSLDYTGDPRTDAPQNRGAGTLRRGRMTVGPDFLVKPDRFTTSPNSPTFVCQGDSGGPQFYNENGVLKIIGVNSAAFGTHLPNGKQSCTGTSQVTKVAPFYGWILTEQKKISNLY
jgi:secreted trypsin-like serine protease